jgi:5-methylcytosine-specific restriction endonuclease McrA
MDRCIILNGDYTYLNVVGWQQAIRLLFKEGIEVLKYSDRIVRSAGGEIFRVPLVMRLIKVIRMIYRNRVPYKRSNVFVRDGFQCMYCGARGRVKLNIDHVIPLSRGGKTNFENCVSACEKCNNKKGDKTPKEANMYLRRQPYVPTISEFLRLKMKYLKLDKVLKDLGVY